MQLFPSLLFGISASLDALIVGVAYGIRRIRICLWQNLLISLITLLGTCLSMGLGVFLIPFLPPAAAQAAGSIILMLFGAYYMIKSMLGFFKKCRKKQDFPLQAASLSFPELLSLGLSLSANNMGIGLSASMAGLSPVPAAISTLLCSFFFLFLGNCAGSLRFFRPAQNAGELLSGVLLIFLGILGLF